jgi:hypothetical protein
MFSLGLLLSNDFLYIMRIVVVLYYPFSGCELDNQPAFIRFLKGIEKLIGGIIDIFDNTGVLNVNI